MRMMTFLILVATGCAKDSGSNEDSGVSFPEDTTPDGGDDDSDNGETEGGGDSDGNSTNGDTDADGEDGDPIDEGGAHSDTVVAGVPIINEINTHPVEGADWVEFYNPNAVAYDIADWLIADWKDDETEPRAPSSIETLSPRSTMVPAGGYLVVYTENEDESIGFGLKDDGSEHLYLTFSHVSERYEVTIDLPENINDLSCARTPNGSEVWSNGVTPTPGATNPTSGPSNDTDDGGADEEASSDVAPMINEVNADPADGRDWVEFYNPGDTDHDIHDWVLTDWNEGDATPEATFLVSSLSSDTIVPAGGYLVVFTAGEDESVDDVGFSLKADGSEDIWVGRIEDFSAPSIDLPANEGGNAYARIPDGGETWVNGATPTPGSTNE